MSLNGDRVWKQGRFAELSNQKGKAVFLALVVRFFAPIQVRNEEGASAVEYGLLIAGIAALIAVVVFVLGGAISTLFQSMVTAL
jgi:pilus assembly protein Flp/PilA